MKINKLLTPYNYSAGNVSRIKYIVIHYVGATGGAEVNCKYYASQKLGASAHYFVGHSGEIWQSVEDKNIAWHCGGKKYANTSGGTYHGICTNANSIGIEMCVRKDTNGTWYFEDATVESTIALTKELMEKYNVPAENVIRHFDVNGKQCGVPYVLNNTKHKWSDFKAAISSDSSEKKYTIGWSRDEKGWWYANTPSTYYKSGIFQIGNKLCYFNDAGYAVTGWFKYNNKWYYADENCYVLTSQWIEDKGKNYYLLASGEMAVNCYVLSADKKTLYWIDSNGVWNSNKDLITVPSNDVVFVSK